MAFVKKNRKHLPRVIRQHLSNSVTGNLRDGVYTGTGRQGRLVHVKALGQEKVWLGKSTANSQCGWSVVCGGLLRVGSLKWDEIFFFKSLLLQLAEEWIVGLGTGEETGCDSEQKLFQTFLKWKH